MPYIHLQNAGALTDDQKREIARQMTQTICDVTGKPASATYIVIEEVPRQNWSVGGRLLADVDAEKK